MKKVIFISALAIAAAVSCTKSDIVDTKFNEAISFETYTGRDAMTKAEEADMAKLQTDAFKVYGFYTAEGNYAENTPANLMNQQLVTYENDAWTYQPPKYWTNAEDKYTFLAYSPSTLTSEDAHKLTYVVDQDLQNQIDVLYSNNNLNITKKPEVPFIFKHALARVTVKAKAVMTPVTENGTDYDNTFHVKEITLKGAFNTSGTLDFGKIKTTQNEDGTSTQSLEAKWDATPGTATYNFFTTTDAAVNVATEDKKVNYLTATDTDYAFNVVDEDGKALNYLMAIPTDFESTQEKTVTPATLVVKYSIMSAGEESSVMTKELKIAENFEMGYAYSINLVFALDPENQINFNVTSIDVWENGGEADIVKPDDFKENENENNPELYPNI